MAAELTLEPTLPREEEREENDEGEESDSYDGEHSEEEVDVYEPDEDDDNEPDEEAGEAEPENMTALLLDKQNGTTRAEDDDDDEEEDEDYHEDTDKVSINAGSKRGADELSEEDAHGDEGYEEAKAEGEKLSKKVRV